MSNEKETKKPGTPEKPRTVRSARSVELIKTKEKGARTKAAAGLVGENAENPFDTEQKSNEVGKWHKHYDGLMAEGLTDHVVDMLTYRIRDSGVTPTEEQSAKIVSWLEHKIQAPESELTDDALRMQWPYADSDPTIPELFRKLYRQQFETFSSLIGARGTKEGVAAERKRFSEWKKQDTESHFDRIMDEVVGDETGDIRGKIFHVRRILENPQNYADVLRSEKDEECLSALLPHLLNIEKIQARRLDFDGLPLSDKAGREKISKEINQGISEEYRQMRAEVKKVLTDSQAWLKEQFEAGNLHAWSEEQKIMLKARPAGRFGEMTDLGKAAVEKAVKERNAELYALTDAERGLEGPGWQNMVKEKRTWVTRQIEAQLMSVVGLGKKEKFGNLFKGLFLGTNDLALEKGQKSENKEFLRDIFYDSGFMSQLYLKKTPKEGSRMVREDIRGREVIKELMSLAKELFPGEGEMMAVNGIDKMLFDQIRHDNEKRKGREERYGFNVETSHYHQRAPLNDLAGREVPFDSLDSVRGKDGSELKANLEKINIATIIEYNPYDLKKVLSDLIRMYKTHFGEDFTKKKFLGLVLQAPRDLELPQGVRYEEEMEIDPRLRESITKVTIERLLEEQLICFGELVTDLKNSPGTNGTAETVIYTSKESREAVDQGLALQEIAKRKGISVEQLLASLAA